MADESDRSALELLAAFETTHVAARLGKDIVSHHVTPYVLGPTEMRRRTLHACLYAEELLAVRGYDEYFEQCVRGQVEIDMSEFRLRFLALTMESAFDKIVAQFYTPSSYSYRKDALDAFREHLHARGVDLRVPLVWSQCMVAVYDAE
jgi:hypothetical protein